MAITKNITIDEREVPFKASAALPRIYRARFGRDMLKDFDAIMAAVDTDGGEGIDESDGKGRLKLSSLDMRTLQTFEDIAYTMAKYADPTIPDTAEDWLDGFNTFSIYMVLPQLLELWGLNVRTEAEAKKNLNRLTAK